MAQALEKKYNTKATIYHLQLQLAGSRRSYSPVHLSGYPMLWRNMALPPGCHMIIVTETMMFDIGVHEITKSSWRF